MSATIPADPFSAMGHPITSKGRQAGILLLIELGYSIEAAHAATDQVASALERNDSELAFRECRTFTRREDVTLHYRLIATLLTHANMQTAQTRGGKSVEAVIEEGMPI